MCWWARPAVLSPALFDSRSMSVSSCDKGHCLFWDCSDATLSLFFFVSFYINFLREHNLIESRVLETDLLTFTLTSVLFHHKKKKKQAEAT